MEVRHYLNTVVRRESRRGWVVGYDDREEAEKPLQIGWDRDTVTGEEYDDEWVAIDDVRIDWFESWEWQREHIERLEGEVMEARTVEQVCREGFSKLRDLCVDKGYQVVPHLQEYEPLKATMESLEGMKEEVARRLEEVRSRKRK